MKFALWMLVEEAVSSVKASHSLPVWGKDDEKSHRFLKWLKDLGIDIDSLNTKKPVEIPLPFGGNGVVGTYVVKFTPNQNEAKFATKMIGKTLDKIARIYDVIQIPNKHIFAIVQEKLHFGDQMPLRIAGDMVYKYLDNQTPKDVDTAYNYIMKNLLPGKYRGNKDVENMTRQVLLAAMKLQKGKQ